MQVAGPVLLMFAAALSGCMTAKTEARLTAQDQAITQLRQDVEALTRTVVELTAAQEDDRLRASREKYCKDPQIAQFMTDLQEGVPDTCSADGLNSALGYIRKMPCAVAHLKPEADMELRPARLGRLRDILDPPKIHPSTRLVLMAKPAEDTRAGRARAEELANQLKTRVLLKILSQGRAGGGRQAGKAREVEILGPYLLPCQLRKDISELYKKAYFRPIPGEPLEGKPAVVLFVFVTDC